MLYSWYSFCGCTTILSVYRNPLNIHSCGIISAIEGSKSVGCAFVPMVVQCSLFNASVHTHAALLVYYMYSALHTCVCTLYTTCAYMALQYMYVVTMCMYSAHVHVHEMYIVPCVLLMYHTHYEWTFSLKHLRGHLPRLLLLILQLQHSVSTVLYILFH